MNFCFLNELKIKAAQSLVHSHFSVSLARWPDLHTPFFTSELHFPRRRLLHPRRINLWIANEWLFFGIFSFGFRSIRRFCCCQPYGINKTKHLAVVAAAVFFLQKYVMAGSNYFVLWWWTKPIHRREQNKTKPDQFSSVEKEQKCIQTFQQHFHLHSHVCNYKMFCGCVRVCVIRYLNSTSSLSAVSLAVSHILCYCHFSQFIEQKMEKYLNIETVARYRILIFCFTSFAPSLPSISVVHLFLPLPCNIHLCTYRLELLLSSCVSMLYNNCVDSLILIVVSHTFPAVRVCLSVCLRVCVCVFYLSFGMKNMWMWCIRLYSNKSNRN